MKIYLFQLYGYGYADTIFGSLSRADAVFVMDLYIEAEQKEHYKEHDWEYEDMYDWDVIEMEIPEINI